MPQSVQPITSAAMSALIWELDLNANAVAVFGPTPIGGQPAAPTGQMLLGRLAGVLEVLRERVVPNVFNSLNRSQITIVHRAESSVAGDPLGVKYTETGEDIYAVISGPTTETLERGLLDISDYEVLIPAHTLGTIITENDGFIIDSIFYDVVSVQAYPKVPDPVAYRYFAKRLV